MADGGEISGFVLWWWWWWRNDAVKHALGFISDGSFTLNSEFLRKSSYNNSRSIIIIIVIIIIIISSSSSSSVS